MDKYDFVNNPSHYASSESSLTAIEVIEAFKLNFSRGSALKYILRAGAKPEQDEVQDLEKAVWYLSREIKRVQQARKYIGEAK